MGVAPLGLGVRLLKSNPELGLGVVEVVVTLVVKLEVGVALLLKLATGLFNARS